MRLEKCLKTGEACALIASIAFAAPLGCGGSEKSEGDADTWESAEEGAQDVATDVPGDADGFDLPDGTDSRDLPGDDAWINPDAPSSCEKTTDLSFSYLGGAYMESYQVVDEDRDVLLIFPAYIGPSTKHLSAVSLTDGSEEAVVLGVTGDVPPLKIAAAAYDPSSERSVLLAYAMAHPGDGGIGDHMELLTVTLDGAGGAAMTRLSPGSPPASEGTMFSWVYPEGDGVHYRAFRFGLASDRAAVTGSAVTWEPEVALTSEGAFEQNFIAHDPTGHRLIGYGELVVEGTPEDYTTWFEPNVFVLSLAGGTSWTKMTTYGMGPQRQEAPYGIVSALALYDDGGSRLIVMQDHPYTDPWLGEIMVVGIWALANEGTWSVINENMGYCCTTMISGADDRERRRFLTVIGSALRGVDLSPGSEGQSLSIDLGLSLSPGITSADFDTARGRILASAEAGLISMAVRDGDYLWRDADGGAAWPMASSIGHTIVYDAAADRAVLFGGTDSTTTNQTADVHTLDLGSPSPSWTMATVSGSPPGPRAWHGAVADAASGTMFVAGGYRMEGTSVVDHADVFALDLATMAWRLLATLPSARSAPILRLAGGGADLYVLFGEQHSNPSDPFTVTDLRDAFRISTSTGEVETLAVTGELPTVTTRALTALDLPSAFVISSPEPDGVDVFRRDFTPGSVSVTRTSSCEDPRALGYGPGVVDPATGRGYVLGYSSWEVSE